MLPSAGPRSWLAPNARLRFDVVRRRLASVAHPASFLEVGCGQGALATELAPHFDYLGYEPDPTSFAIARSRIEAVGRGRVLNAQLPDIPTDQFDVMGAFEVLEHIDDDRTAVQQWMQWVKPGGHLIVSVPANPDRFGPWDVEVGHFRRYSRASLTATLDAAGLEAVDVTTYGFPLGYLLELVRNRIAGGDHGPTLSGDQDVTAETMEARTASSGRKLQPGAKLAPVVWAGTLPFLWAQRPFGRGNLGTGLVAIGRVRG